MNITSLQRTFIILVFLLILNHLQLSYSFQCDIWSLSWDIKSDDCIKSTIFQNMIKELPLLLICLFMMADANRESPKALNTSSLQFPVKKQTVGALREVCFLNEQPIWQNINEWIAVNQNTRFPFKNMFKKKFEVMQLGGDDLTFSPNLIVTNISCKNQSKQRNELMRSNYSLTENGNSIDGLQGYGESRYDLSSFRHTSDQLCHQSPENIQLRNDPKIIQKDNSWKQLMLIVSLLLGLSLILLFGYVAYLKLLKEKQILLNRLEKLSVEKQSMQSDLKSKLQFIKLQSNFYEVYWDKLVDEVHDKKCYDHLVYEGRFINQQAFVYVVKLSGIDIQTLERKLNKLLRCSHSRLSKLYFYTQTDQHLFVFTQKLRPLASQNLPQYLNINAPQSSKRNVITQIIDTLNYLQYKIELKWLPLHSIELEYKVKRDHGSFQFKINAIPCLFRRMPDRCDNQQIDTTSQDVPCFVRHNIAALFHLILMNGNSYNKTKKIEVVYRDLLSQQYKEFLNFILYEARAIGHTHQLLFRQVKDHPFLWDTKRKILFLSDFSNYIETHLDQQRVEKLQDYANYYNIVEQNWSKPLHHLLAQQINTYRKYDFESVRDLVRMIRNKINHFHQIPKDTKVHVGKTPQKFMDYCLQKFPKLLYFAYNYTRKKKWRLHMK